MLPKAHGVADSLLVRGVRGAASSFKHSPRRSARTGQVRPPPPRHTLQRTGVPHTPPPFENKGQSTKKNDGNNTCCSDKLIVQTRPRKRQAVTLPLCMLHAWLPGCLNNQTCGKKRQGSNQHPKIAGELHTRCGSRPHSHRSSTHLATSIRTTG